MASPVSEGSLDVRRMCCISQKRPTDHGKDVMVVDNPDFDLDSTIFKTMDIPAVKEDLRKKLGKRVFWSDAAIIRVLAQYQQVPTPMPYDRAILDFIHNQCNFTMEHADGSFMDHLKFCHDFSATHFKAHSPRVLFLHSMFGTATNVFPMGVDKEETLRGLLSPEEFAHVNAFPAINRLVHVFVFGDMLLKNLDKLPFLEKIVMHRPIDNETIELSAEQLWVHLNYHLIHELDFLPLANWSETASEGSFQALLQVYSLLTKAGKLMVDLDMNLTCGNGQSITEAMGSISPEQMKKGHEGMAWFNDYMSKKIDHSLHFELVFPEAKALEAPAPAAAATAKVPPVPAVAAKIAPAPTAAAEGGDAAV